MALYLIANGAMPTTAAFVKVTTGTSVKTMQQVQASATNGFKIREWGVSFDGNSAATPIEVELIDTGTVAATVTANAQADIMPFDAMAYNNGNVVTNLIPVGTTATGFTSTSEGSIASIRTLDLQLVAPTNQYIKQFPLGTEPYIPPGHNARIRVTAGAAVNAYTYMIVEV